MLRRALIRLVLLGYPGALRREYGEEIEAVFHARLQLARRDGSGAAARLWLRELAGGLQVWLRGLAGLPERPPRAARRTSPREHLMLTLERTLQDLRFAARTLAKRPGFTLAAVLVLALGIGANTAIFSVVDAVLIEPLPFADPERLQLVYEIDDERGWSTAQVSGANFLDWREQASSFSSMAAHNDWLDEIAWLGGGEPEVVRGTRVTGNFFDVLGVEMTLGRGFEPDDDWAGDEARVVLTHAFWSGRLGADPEVVGSRIELDGAPHTVVGVAPPGFDFPFADVDLWRPVNWEEEAVTQVWFRRAHFLRVIGRLAPGVERAAASAELEAIAARLAAEYPETNRGLSAGFMSLKDWTVGDSRAPILVLVLAVGLVLAVACTNVANMQLARASERGREMEIRAAVGAAQGRLVRQALTESVLLALLGGVAGVAIAAAALAAWSRLEAASVTASADTSLDPSVLAFTFSITLLAGLLFGLVPALRAGRAARFGAAERSVAGGAGRTPKLLVAAQMAMVVPLVIAVGLLVRSAGELARVDPGFDPQGVVVFEYSLPDSRYPGNAERAAFHDRLLRAVEALPVVESVGIGTRMPFRNQRWTSDFRLESWEPERYGVDIRHDEIHGDLFEALGVPVLQGATFTEQMAEDRLVAIVNQAFVDEHLGGADPIGERLCNDRLPEDCRYWFEIVGVVGNVRRVHLAQEEEPSVYAFLMQDVTSAARLFVRSEADAEQVVSAVRAATREVDPLLPFSDVVTLEEVTAESFARLRLVLRLLAGFALVALVLGALGVYGVVSYATSRRTREIGVRVTLGAGRKDILRGVFAGGLTPVVAGVVPGLLVAWAASRWLESYLYEVAPTDPVTLAVAVVLLLFAAVVACWIPARRALRVDPVEALRQS